MTDTPTSTFGDPNCGHCGAYIGVGQTPHQQHTTTCAAVRRLEQANAKLIAALDDTRARMRAAEAATEAAEDRIQELRIQLDQATGGNRG